jgi:dynein heavy chain 1
LLIKKVSKIKTDMEKVNKKVETSKKLLTNLSSEKERWTETSNNFSE